MKRRMNNLFRNDGKAFILAMDHSAQMPSPDLADPEHCAVFPLICRETATLDKSIYSSMIGSSAGTVISSAFVIPKDDMARRNNKIKAMVFFITNLLYCLLIHKTIQENKVQRVF